MFPVTPYDTVGMPPAPRTTEVALLSTDFLRKQHEPFTVHPSWNLWVRWMDIGHNATRAFIRITQGDQTFVCAVGDPAESDEEDDALFLPLWMIDTGQFVLSETVREPHHGEDEYTPRSHTTNAQATVLLSTELPPATRILLRPVEMYLSVVDIKDALQPILTKLGVFQQGVQYEIPLEELGGLRVNFIVEELEPEPVALLDGDEIALEFSQAIETMNTSPTIVPVSPPALEPTPVSAITPFGGLPSSLHGMIPDSLFEDARGITPTTPMPSPVVTTPTVPPPHRTAAELNELRTRRLAIFGKTVQPVLP